MRRTFVLGSRLSPGLISLVLAMGSAGCHRSDALAAGDGGRASAGSEAGDIGVAECDGYVAKVRQCIETRVSAEKKAPFEEHLARTRATWTTLASNPGARPGLPQTCELALQTAKTTMRDYACAW